MIAILQPESQNRGCRIAVFIFNSGRMGVMGLTLDSTGIKSMRESLTVVRKNEEERVVALAGNPNVGKSTVFNALTGMNQHTGNWPGKTVANAQGRCSYYGTDYMMVDLPGTYSLMAHSAEEEVARNFICFGEPDAVVVVCDATCLERNMNLVLQTIEITPRTVVCINLMDEARKKHIQIDFGSLQKDLGVPVVGVTARSSRGLEKLMTMVGGLRDELFVNPIKIRYPAPVEEAAAMIEPALESRLAGRMNARWAALRLLEHNASLLEALKHFLGFDILADEEIAAKMEQAQNHLIQNGISRETLEDKIVSSIVTAAEGICADAISFDRPNYNARDRKIDRFLTSKWTGIPAMILLLVFIFWITLTGANYPSVLLSGVLFRFQDFLLAAMNHAGAPEWLSGVLILGVYRVLAWVVSVMLPPMAIFFPLFTLLEDFGYLPRVAFNLDKYFKKAHACGKQALTMCMGFGCNAAGIVGCRIIDSPRERLIAILTNNFVPCNGRFPTLIAIISMFFVGTVAAPFQSFASTLILAGVIVLGVCMTFLISRLLSMTILKGIPSSFTLELPPYRRPQIGKVIVRSVFDRTLFVLGRAVSVAAPAGLILWLMANIQIGSASVLAHCAAFLNPFAHLLGLDGVILLAFILGFPANEIVVPIIIMAYMATGNIQEFSSLTELKTLLVNNGWTWLTAICTMLFSLMHWPCSTTCLTIKKETQSLKWTAISAAVPAATGIAVCFLVATAARLLGLAA